MTTPAAPRNDRPRHPGENLDEGFYLHPQSARVTTITGPDGAQMVLVAAEDFMRVQKERDDYRRVVALINAWRKTPGRSETDLRALLAQTGEGDEEAQVMRGLIAWARDQNRD